MKEFAVAFDIGTTNNKVSIFDKLGKLVVQKSRETPLIFNAHGMGWMEKDADAIWNSLCSICKEIIEESGLDVKKIAGVGVTALRQSIVPVDEHGNAIRDAILWGTKATYRQVQFMEDRIGCKRVHEITTRPINPVWAATSILYILQEEREIAKRTHKILEIEDFVLYKLGTDDFYSDHSQSGAIELYDIFKRNWSEELCECLEVPINILPKLVEAGMIVGTVSDRSSSLTGIPVGTPIVAGGGDCQTSAIGCGVIEKGKANMVIGTAAVGSIFTVNPVIDPLARFVCTPHSMPGCYVVDNNTLSGGVSYKWYVDTFFNKNAKDKYVEVDREVKKIPVGARSVMFIPHLVGSACPYWDAQSKGVFVGMTLQTSKYDMARAVIEGSCMEISKGFALIEKMGIDLNEIVICGGACKKGSPWNQIQADIYGKPVVLTEAAEITTSLGCAILVEVACGVHGSLQEAVDVMVSLGETLMPDEEKHKKYIDLMRIHDDIYQALKGKRIFESLFLNE